MKRIIFLLGLVLSMGLSKVETAGNKSEGLLDHEYTQDNPRWFQEYKLWYLNSRLEQSFYGPNASFKFLDSAFGSPLLKTRNIVMAPCDRWSTLQKNIIDSRALDLFHAGDVDLSQASLTLGSHWFSTFKKNYPHSTDPVPFDTAIQREIGHVKSLQKINIRLWTPFFQGLSKRRFYKDHKITYEAMTKQVGLKGLACILEKEADVDELVHATKCRITSFLENSWCFFYFADEAYPFSCYSLSMKKADEIRVFLQAMISCEDLPEVVDIPSAIDHLELSAVIEGVKERISPKDIDLSNYKDCFKDFSTVATFLGIGIITKDEAQEFYNEIIAQLKELEHNSLDSNALTRTKILSLKNNTIADNGIFPVYEFYCLYGELHLDGNIEFNLEFKENSLRLIEQVFEGKFSKKQSARK